MLRQINSKNGSDQNLELNAYIGNSKFKNSHNEQQDAYACYDVHFKNPEHNTCNEPDEQNYYQFSAVNENYSVQQSTNDSFLKNKASIYNSESLHQEFDKISSLVNQSISPKNSRSKCITEKFDVGNEMIEKNVDSSKLKVNEKVLKETKKTNESEIVSLIESEVDPDSSREEDSGSDKEYSDAIIDNNTIIDSSKLSKKKMKKKISMQRQKFTISSILIKAINAQLKQVHKFKYPAKRIYPPVMGTKRDILKDRLQHASVSGYMTELHEKVALKSDAFNDGDAMDLHTSSVAYKVKSERKCNERLKLESLDFQDALQLCINDLQSGDTFFQRFGFPITAVMYHETCYHRFIEEKYRILHYDATGSIVRDPQIGVDGKKIFGYFLIASVREQLLVIGSMLTSEHGIASQSSFLGDVRQFCESQIKEWPIAKAIVTDWSWPSINSIMKSWNCMSVIKYLQLMYMYVNKEVSRHELRNTTILKLCYSHFMHMVSRTIENKFSEYIDFKDIIIQSMSLLCLTTNITDMDENFRQICIIFLTRSKETANESICTIHNNLKKSSDIQKPICKNAEDHKIRDERIRNFKTDEKYGTIYTNSPFYKRYSEMELFLRKKITLDDSTNSANTEVNKYRAPKFIEHLLKNYMPYVVWWSALDMDLVYPEISRVSNAIVESFNKVLKVNILEGNTKNSIADTVRQLNTYNRGKLAKINVPDIILKENGSKKQKPQYPLVHKEKEVIEEVNNPSSTDKWSKGRRGQSKRKRKPHAKLKKIIKIATEEKKKQPEEKMSDFVVLNSDTQNDQNNRINGVNGVESKINSLENEKLNLPVESKNVNKNENSFHNRGNQVTLDEVLKFPNGLFKDEKRSMISDSANIYVARCTTTKSLRLQNFDIAAREFASIRYPRWINGYDDSKRAIDALNCFTQYCIKTTTLRQLFDIKWTQKFHENVPKQPNDDEINCGVYVMHYLDKMGREQAFDGELNLLQYRDFIAQNLLEKSENIMEDCLHCARTVHHTDPKTEIEIPYYTCAYCDRKWHVHCNKYSHKDTDEEKETFNSPVPKRMKLTKKHNVCRLCRKFYKTY
uniref:Ubiquitin-like protease family profile domain-containing protein n=1 Tax=Trichogramma kaykai TaxID=54128 RepID=A0ABD2VUU2_9HYME